MKKRIMIDMDDVIVENGLQNMMKEFVGGDIDLLQNHYYIQDSLGDKKEKFFEYFITKNLYDYVEEVDGAFDAIKALSEQYDIYICTAYIWREIVMHAGMNLKNKFDYLHHKFSFLDPEKFIFTGSKSIIDCHIKIDDKINNLENATETKILFPAFHNNNLDKEELKKQGIIKVSGWKEITDMLLKN